MAMEAVAASIRLLSNPPRLAPRAVDVTAGGFPPRIDAGLVSFLVGTDTDAADVLENWEPVLPERFRSIGLTRIQRVHLQRRRLLLRNRRIVSGYQLLDDALRAKLAGGGPADRLPPTWLTVGKWTARTIGDLLEGEIPVSENRRILRMLVRRLVGFAARWRTMAMGRTLVLGNREIFAQVAGVLTAFVNTDFAVTGLDFTGFVARYGEALIGLNDPDIPDELLISIKAATRDPLSDSMLRALHAYYRAIHAPSDDEREKWVQAGNLHLAAYEQRVAQTFVDLGLAARVGRTLASLFAGPTPGRPAESAAIGRRPLDMLLEPGFLARVLDLAAAAFATRYIIAIAVGLPGEGAPPEVFAPADPLDLLSVELKNRARAMTDEKDAAGLALRRIWISLDRADGVPTRCLVRDWRTYSARISYIANLFVVSAMKTGTARRFCEPVFGEDDLRLFLGGRLTDEFDVLLTDEQVRAVERLLAQPQESRGLAVAAE